jgi:hypothetical protein
VPKRGARFYFALPKEARMGTVIERMHESGTSPLSSGAMLLDNRPASENELSPETVGKQDRSYTL